MIDYLKYEVNGIAPGLLEQNPVLDFHNKVNTSTGELGTYINAYFRGTEFKIYEPTTANPQRRITVEGSLHKYWNKGAHNFNDFGINEIDEVLKDLKQRFRIEPENCILKGLEVGVNIRPPGKTKSHLKQCLMHKTERLKWVFTKDEGNYIQAQHQRHVLKIYDKKQHYKVRGFDIEDEVMRIEMKFLKMYDLNQKGIYTLTDLLKYGLNNFTPLLLEHWEQVLFYDHSVFKGTKYEHLYSNPNFWESLSKSNRQYHKTNLKKITSEHPKNIKKQIAEMIKEKADFLNTQTNQINPLHIGLKRTVSTSENYDPNRRFCSITGLNISMQKNDSILLSHTGLKYYYKTDKKVYDEVKRKFLSGRWQEADHKTQIKEIAHNIRNRQNNQKLQQERLYNAAQPTLFNIGLQF